MWPIGISTGIAYRHSIDAVLEPIRAAGVERIEVSTAPQHIDLGNQGALRDLGLRIRESGLVVHSIHAPFGHDVNLTSPDTHLRESSIERLVQAAEALAILGGGLYVIHPGGEDQRWVWERESRLALSVEGLCRIHAQCVARDLTLVLETPLPHLLGGQPDDFAWILARIPGEHTGVCIDTSHCSLGGFLFDAVTRFKDRLVHVQVSDNRGSTDDHLPPGAGVIDWPRFRGALATVGYAGVFMLEVSGNGDVAAHVQRAVSGARGVLGMGPEAPPGGDRGA
jgi:sugar phosphate isomerase/epimerase